MTVGKTDNFRLHLRAVRTALMLTVAESGQKVLFFLYKNENNKTHFKKDKVLCVCVFILIGNQSKGHAAIDDLLP